jgi:glycosyltransferase involved in cell wall biosynthesis
VIERVSVLLDATALPQSRGGVGRYIEGLVSSLDAEHVELTIAAQARDAHYFRDAAPGARVVALPSLFAARPLRLIWEQIGLPVLASRHRVDVVHSPHYTFPLLSRRARVVTLHDATFFSDPASHGRLKRIFFRAWTRWSWSSAAGVIVPSAATASEIVRFIGEPARPAAVAHHGVDTAVFRPPSDEQLRAFRELLGLSPDERWIAFLGTIEPRKNVPQLLAAHRALRAADLAGTPSLIISGARGWDAEAARLLDDLDEDSGVREVGYLPIDSLAPLLGGSEVVVYPSSGEGFGLPVLEAMSAGATVLTTRRLALPEVGGDAVSYTETDVQSLTQSLAALLGDPESRHELSRRAIARASQFSWSACASAHEGAYRRAAGGDDV